MKSLFLYLILLCLPFLSLGQGWENTYNDFDYGYEVIEDSDGNFVVTGGSCFAYLFKVDSIGNFICSKTYDADFGHSIQQTTDGGYIIGATSGSSSKMHLIKTNVSGDTSWTRSYGKYIQNIGYAAQQIFDGGYILCGFTKDVNDYHYIYLIKTDVNGDSIWSKTYGDYWNTFAWSVQQTADSGYIVTGTTNNQIFLMKTDANGGTLWNKSYDGNRTGHSRPVSQTTDGGYVVVGSTSANGNGAEAFLIKTDANGDTLWTKTYGKYNSFGIYSSGQAFSVQQTNDDGYIISGEIFDMSSGCDLFLIKTETSGDTLWTKTFGGQYIENGHSVQQTSDGGYIITGVSDNGLYLIKTDNLGNVSSTNRIDIAKPKPERKILRIIDLMGRVIDKPIKNTPYIEIYDDGTAQKKMSFEITP